MKKLKLKSIKAALENLNLKYEVDDASWGNVLIRLKKDTKLALMDLYAIWFQLGKPALDITGGRGYTIELFFKNVLELTAKEKAIIKWTARKTSGNLNWLSLW